ncbi:MAG: CU044_2847 family protein [Cyanobacteria bacterium]|nr:CU044_2847 family protein [Cyanobacteriota bacterium]
MTQLAPLTLDDGTVIYIEATDDMTDLPVTAADPSEGQTLTSKGVSNQVVKQFQAMQGMIRAYTGYTLNAFRQMAGAKVDKVTLEFGIKVAGEAGLPYVTKGTADANLKVTVECSFPDKTP